MLRLTYNLVQFCCNYVATYHDKQEEPIDHIIPMLRQSGFFLAKQIFTIPLKEDQECQQVEQFSLNREELKELSSDSRGVTDAKIRQILMKRAFGLN